MAPIPPPRSVHKYRFKKVSSVKQLEPPSPKKDLAFKFQSKMLRIFQRVVENPEYAKRPTAAVLLRYWKTVTAQGVSWRYAYTGSVGKEPTQEALKLGACDRCRANSRHCLMPFVASVKAGTSEEIWEPVEICMGCATAGVSCSHRLYEPRSQKITIPIERRRTLLNLAASAWEKLGEVGDKVDPIDPFITEVMRVAVSLLTFGSDDCPRPIDIELPEFPGLVNGKLDESMPIKDLLEHSYDWLERAENLIAQSKQRLPPIPGGATLNLE